jgi:hypothetical protein
MKVSDLWLSLGNALHKKQEKPYVKMRKKIIPKKKEVESTCIICAMYSSNEDCTPIGSKKYHLRSAKKRGTSLKDEGVGGICMDQR